MYNFVYACMHVYVYVRVWAYMYVRMYMCAWDVCKCVCMYGMYVGLSK